MRACILLLIAAPLLAEPSTVARIRLEGAEKLLVLAVQDAESVRKLHDNGAAPIADVETAQRRLLDAKLALLDARWALEPDLAGAAKARRDLLEEVEQLEARRYAAAQKLVAAGKLDAESLLERRVAHQLAWIERNHADQLANAKADARRLAADRERQRATVLVLAARERFERRKKLQAAGAATESELRTAQRELIQAETALAIAKERLRLAEK